MSTLLLADEGKNEKKNKEKKEELEKLIRLAEDVSAKVNDLNKEVERSRWKSLLSNFLLVPLVTVVFLQLSSIYKSGSLTTLAYKQIFFVTIIFAFFFSLLAAYFVIKFRKQVVTTKHDLFSEELILRKLLDMIDPYKSLIELSIIEKAVIDMRLQRIKFSTSEGKSNFILKNNQEVSVSL